MRRKKLLLAILISAFATIFGPTEFDFLTTELAASPQSNNRWGSKVTKKTETKKSTGKKKRTSKRRGRGALITTVYSDPTTGEWIHRGKRKIVIHRDTADRLRAMTPFSGNPNASRQYAEIINSYAEKLGPHGVSVYSLIAPSQGEFYMPQRISDNKSQKEAVTVWNTFLDTIVTPINVFDTLAAHVDEEIYLRTDHHWAPLGAYYAAAKTARQLGDTIFFPLQNCTPDTVKNFVGTMFNFSGDTKIKQYPEDFIYFIPSGVIDGEFIDYTLKSNQVAYRETAPHKAPLFRKFHDGSRSAYSTFLGGDNHTVKTVNPSAPSPKKVLLVKDSYGNALVPYLAQSFAEVHAIDFRHFPHSLTDYVINNSITDLIFVNSIELAFAPITTSRLRELFKSKK